jgi:hypothetical protein
VSRLHGTALTRLHDTGQCTERGSGVPADDHGVAGDVRHDRSIRQSACASAVSDGVADDDVEQGVHWALLE